MPEFPDSLEQERREVLAKEMAENPKDPLSAAEAVAMQSEELTRARQAKGYDPDWEERANEKIRRGRNMWSSDFLRRLRGIMPNLIVSRGRVNKTISLYVSQNTPVDEAQDYWNPNGLNYFDRPVFVGWVDEGEMPEYEIDIYNDVKIPIGRKRGWRTVLLNLIVRWEYEKVIRFTPGLKFEFVDKRNIFGKRIRDRRASLITEAQALEAFGHPTNGATASAYRQQLYEFRNAASEVEHPQDEEAKFGPNPFSMY